MPCRVGLGKEGVRRKRVPASLCLKPILQGRPRSLRAQRQGPGLSLLCGMQLGRDKRRKEASAELRSHKSQGVTQRSVGPT